jgi:hypothetical protein
MARAKSERARSKSLAIDDLTQSIEQLQAFIPKLEDLGRDGFPYLEGALTRTELQLRECIKRAFGDKSPEFQTHRHLKLALSSATEKKQTLTLLRSLIASLEDKKLELQGLKPPVNQAAPSSTPPQLGLVPPSVSTAQVSVTTVTTTSRPTGTTLHLVPGIDNAAVTALQSLPLHQQPAHRLLQSWNRHRRQSCRPCNRYRHGHRSNRSLRCSAHKKPNPSRQHQSKLYLHRLHLLLSLHLHEPRYLHRLLRLLPSIHRVLQL